MNSWRYRSCRRCLEIAMAWEQRHFANPFMAGGPPMTHQMDGQDGLCSEHRGRLRAQPSGWAQAEPEGQE
jgi:hypothetical protein